MAISNENLELLFDVMSFYDKEYNEIADNCFEELNRALNEICSNIENQIIKVVPFCSYAIKTNYQVFEPMEFFCVLKSDRRVLQKENIQKLQQNKPKKRTIKTIYNEILQQSNQDEQTSIDIAKIIAEQLERYINEDDKVAQKNNVIYTKLKISDQIEISAIIYVAYDFDDDENIEFSKLGYKTKQNPNLILKSIQEKNLQTNGNYILLCKLIKMLELELVCSNSTNILLSSKTLFVENVLYNVPNKFYQCEKYDEMLQNVINYLNQCDIKDIVIPGENTQMFDNKNYYANSHFNNFISKLIFIYKNANQMIDTAIKLNNQSAENNIEKNKKIDKNTNNQKNIKKINKNVK